MEITFVKIAIVLFFLIIVPFCKLLHDRLTFNNKNSILNKILMNANYYAFNSIGLDAVIFSELPEDIQNNFIGYGIGWLRQNHNEILNQYNVNNNDILCSLLIAKLHKIGREK